MFFSTDTVNLVAAGPPPIGSTSGAGDGPPRKVNPRQETIVGGPYMGRSPRGAGSGVLLSQSVDDVVAQFGIRVYELMLHDSAVACAFALLKAGILSDGLQVSPAVKRDPGDAASQRSQKADLKLAQEIADATERSLELLEDPVDETLEELLDAYAFGCNLAELTFARAVGGPDKGRDVMQSLVPKPRWSWGFRVNQFNRVVAIRGWTGEGWEDIDRGKFAVLTWQPRYRDPRGRSGLRPAYNPWNMKLQEYPELAEYLHHFAQPGIIATAGQDAQAHFTTDPITGRRQYRDVLDVIGQALEAFKSRSYMALPYGSTATLLQSTGNGEAYHSAFERFDMEIFRTILFASRSVQEAKHGSKADTDSAQDLVGLAFKRGRAPLVRMVERDVFRPFVLLNWGPEVADRLTPKASFGAQDNVQSDMLTAFGSAYSSGFIDEAQLPVLWDRLGLPPIDEAAMSQRLERKTAEAQAELQPPGGAAAGKNPAQGKTGPAAGGGEAKVTNPVDRKNRKAA